MKFQTLGAKKQYCSVTVKNQDSITAPQGTPLFYKANTTGTVGLDVITDTALASASQGMFAGIALENIATKRFGDACCYGVVSAIVAVATRSATSAVWASYAAGNIGDILQFSTALAAGALWNSAAGSASNQLWLIQLVDTYASQTTQASSLTPTGTVSTTLLKVLVRSM